MGLFFRDVHYLSCTYPSPCICDAALMIHFKFRTLLLISLIGILNVTDFLNHLLCLSWAPLWPITAHLTSYRNMNSIHEQCEESYESFLLNFWKWQNRAITHPETLPVICFFSETWHHMKTIQIPPISLLLKLLKNFYILLTSLTALLLCLYSLNPSCHL